MGILSGIARVYKSLLNTEVSGNNIEDLKAEAEKCGVSVKELEELTRVSESADKKARDFGERRKRKNEENYRR